LLRSKSTGPSAASVAASGSIWSINGNKAAKLPTAATAPVVTYTKSRRVATSGSIVIAGCDTGATHKEDGPRHIRRFSVDANGAKLSGGDIFAECTAGLFDGLRVDRSGRIWTSTGEGVHCYDAFGSLIGKILIPEIVANVTFGGTKLNRLFICGTTSLYSIYVTANGSKPG
jgi:hypothetical protein